MGFAVSDMWFQLDVLAELRPSAQAPYALSMLRMLGSAVLTDAPAEHSAAA